MVYLTEEHLKVRCEQSLPFLNLEAQYLTSSLSTKDYLWVESDCSDELYQSDRRTQNLINQQIDVIYDIGVQNIDNWVIFSFLNLTIILEFIISMYRKSIDYNLQAAIQFVQFSSFKKKNELTPELIVDNNIFPQFRIKKSSNTLLCIIVIVNLLNQSKHRSKRNFNNLGRVFTDFPIENIPKSFYIYQHENTLQQLWMLISEKTKDLYTLQDLLANYTITEFVLNCYARKCVKAYIDNNLNSKQVQLDLLGNESQILMDYNIELRGKLLHLLASSFRVYVCIVYRDSASQLDNSYKEYFGDKNSPTTAEIWDSGDYFKVSARLEEQVKLASIQSSTNILGLSFKKEAESLQTTAQNNLNSGRPNQSRSTNKEIRCSKCNGKSRCECDRFPKKIAFQKTINTNVHHANSVNTKDSMHSPITTNRSIFDNIGFSNPPKRQQNQHESNSMKK